MGVFKLDAEFGFETEEYANEGLCGCSGGLVCAVLEREYGATGGSDGSSVGVPAADGVGVVCVYPDRLLKRSSACGVCGSAVAVLRV